MRAAGYSRVQVADGCPLTSRRHVCLNCPLPKKRR